MSRVGLGTWQIGTSYWGWGAEFDREKAIRVIRTALELGVNLIDTAELYGWGTSERVVGEAVRDVRDEVVIATKVSPWHPTPRGVRRALEGSLRRLGVDYVDLYQIHWPNPLVPLGRTMRALERLLEEGRIRAIGVSNFSLRRLEEARSHLSRHDVASNQVEYNLLKRDVEGDLLPYCEREKITLMAYSPLAQGLLTGKYGPGRMPPGLQRRITVLLRYGGSGRLSRVLGALREVADARGVTPSQVALNWVLRSPAVVAIPGAKREEHVRQNARAVGWSLSPGEFEVIERALRG